ncbi:MAG: ribosome-associated translation inhibitor RaiA [Clostridiales bacterium]|nr:ribosome-associated translation inhibitor RaiA [Clostridiales bacterium]
MKIEITTRNCNATEHLKGVIEQKINKLDKYFGNPDTSAKVCLKKEGSSLTTEVMLTYAGKFVRATASSDNFYDNLDAVLPKLEGQIRKHRTRFDKNQSNNAFSSGVEFDKAFDYEQKSAGKLVKEKKFTLSPMTVDEAIEEMELLGHNFYVFKNVKTATVQVIYLRNDGDIGLIDPEI